MNLIKPKKLKQGDTITFIAPSGSISEDKVLNSKKYFEAKGFQVKFGKHIFDQDRYLAGKDIDRIQDLEDAFKDKETNAIICVRGGYGALRIINRINYDIIKQNPKIFCGYSDITALSAMILKKTGLITFSSPMPKSDFQFNSTNMYTENHFWQTVTNTKTELTPEAPDIYNNRSEKGILFGGNLATLASMCGLDFIPDREFIFFTEDLNEPVYKIDRYFRQLINTQYFKKNITAMLIGQFLDIDCEKQLRDLINEISKELEIPIFCGYNISHGNKKDTVPIGAEAIVDEHGIVKINY